ncbi:MAG: DegV family protein [Ilumatobacteraceae bacterium]|nr:DegV family protein [Actinomycetota bacterium]MDA3012008.1 DegV family protein [Actinomycetota bacterium]MDA3024608.1 DegV family protein [Actinomycetota bacterium]
MTSFAPGVRIITDSACDLPNDLVEQLGIRIVPLYIRFGDDELVDRDELSTSQFWARCATEEELPSTAAPAPGRFETTIRELAADGATGVVIIGLSGALSATLQSAELGAAAVGDLLPVRVVDSRTVSMGLGSIVVACARAAQDGASIDDVEALARDLVGRCQVWGALDTLENLKKGGRIGGAKAMLASVLSIKPIIEVRNGVVEEGGKQRTRSKAIAFLVDKVRQNVESPGISHLSVLHADCSDVDAFVDQLRTVYNGEILVGDIGAVIGTHAGRGTIGVSYFTV